VQVTNCNSSSTSMILVCLSFFLSVCLHVVSTHFVVVVFSSLLCMHRWWRLHLCGRSFQNVYAQLYVGQRTKWRSWG
jgi:hypothetical protein